MKGRTGRYLA